MTITHARSCYRPGLEGDLPRLQSPSTKAMLGAQDIHFDTASSEQREGDTLFIIDMENHRHCSQS